MSGKHKLICISQRDTGTIVSVDICAFRYISFLLNININDAHMLKNHQLSIRVFGTHCVGIDGNLHFLDGAGKKGSFKKQLSLLSSQMVIGVTVQQPKSWKPDRPISRGATAFHDAVIDASWNHKCLDKLISLAKPNIRENDTVVDFGCGTGTSSVRILENLKMRIRLWMVDNSPAWLGKAYEVLGSRQNVDFFLLKRKDERYATLSEEVGFETVDHVLSANTVHLIPDLKEAFKGIADALKSKGTFVFNTGNFTRKGRKRGILMLDSTVYRVHDIAIGIIRRNSEFKKYRENLDKLIEAYTPLRKFIFPDPRPIEEYLKALKAAGFKYIEPIYRCFRLKYKDWANFLRIRRLQAGILPEVGGKNPGAEEEKDRDTLIAMSAKKLFEELEEFNPFADDKSYLGEWAYISAVKAQS